MLLATAVPVFLSLGWEFMPPLNEGTLLYMPTAPPGISIGEASRILQLMDRELREVPEVERVFGKIGRADTPTDPAPLSMVETIVQLAPRESWRPGLTWDALVEELDQKLHYPGMPNLWWMPIQTRTEMLATGVRSQLGVKVFGDDLAVVEQAAIAIATALMEVPGTRNAFAERATGAFYLDARTDRARAARYGISVEDVNTALEAAIGGKVVSQTVEGRERYAIQVRYARGFRGDPEAIGPTLVCAARPRMDLRMTVRPVEIGDRDEWLRMRTTLYPDSRPGEVGAWFENADRGGTRARWRRGRMLIESKSRASRARTPARSPRRSAKARCEARDAAQPA